MHIDQRQSACVLAGGDTHVGRSVNRGVADLEVIGHVVVLNGLRGELLKAHEDDAVWIGGQLRGHPLSGGIRGRIQAAVLQVHRLLRGVLHAVAF